MKVYFLSQVKDRADTALLNKISSRLEQAHRDSKNHLPTLSDDLGIAVTLDSKKDAWRGSKGFCGWEDFMEITIFKNYEKGIDWILENALVFTFFHESHHAVRWQSVGWGKTLLEGAVAEGLATVYERDTLATRPEWGAYTDVPVKEWYKELVEAEGEEFDHHKWFIEHPDGRKWIGYRVGVYIIDQALANNSSESAASLVSTPAQTIIEMSGIDQASS